MKKLPFFGKLDKDEDYFEVEVTKEQKMQIILDFMGEEPSDEKFPVIEKFLTNLEEIILNVKKQLLSNEFSENVMDYIQHHLEELKSESEIQKITSPEQFIEALKVNSVFISPTDEERFFSMDFTINEELTQYVLVVDMLEDLSISYITTES